MNTCPLPQFNPQGTITNWEDIHQWACDNDTLWSHTVYDMRSVTTDEVKLLRALALCLLIVKDELLKDLRDRALSNPARVMVMDPGGHPPDQVGAIKRLAELAHREHYGCEDRFYSCPKHPDKCSDDHAGTGCNCGADKHNTEVDTIMRNTFPGLTPQPQTPQ